jgi:hypothetical protein
MSYFGLKLFTATCFNIYVGFVIQKQFYMAQQTELKKMMEEQQKAIVQAIK